MATKEFNRGDFFLAAALGGPALFLQDLVPPNQVEQVDRTFTPETSRKLLLLRMLVEVQKYGIALKRWQELAPPDNAEKPTKTFDILALDSLCAEQSLWQRKLLEVLVTLINFCSTNSKEYYYHYLLVRNLTQRRHELAEERDFFAQATQQTHHAVRALEKVLDSVERQWPTLKKTWYLHDGKVRKLASFRRQLLTALPHASLREKRALGYTYENVYGRASESIHFEPMATCESNLLRRFSAGKVFCGLLSIAIMQRAHRLTGVAPRGINKRLLSTARSEPSSLDFVARPVAIGDFVLANGAYLAEVLEVAHTAFQYESYRVRYLDEKPGPGLDEDWVPAPRLEPYRSHRELIQDVKSKLSTESEDFSESEIRDAVREGVLESWQLGIKAYYLRVTQRKGDETE